MRSRWASPPAAAGCSGSFSKDPGLSVTVYPYRLKAVSSLWITAVENDETVDNPGKQRCRRAQRVSGHPSLDVEETHILRVALDEQPPRLDVLAHQDTEQLIRCRRVVERDLAYR